MRSKKLFYFSTTFAAFFMAVFIIGSINQSPVIQDNSINSEPTVVSTSPSDGEVDVHRNIVIEITFSEDVDLMSMNNSTFTLMHGTESVAGTLEYSGKKGMFTSSTSLKAETEYTANITNAVKSDDDYSRDEFNDEQFNDEEFNNEESDERYVEENGIEWSFTTGGNSDPVETVDLGSAAGYVILAQSSIHNESTSNITGEKGFDPDFKNAKEKKAVYWLNNEDVDKEEVRRDSEAVRKDSKEKKSVLQEGAVKESASNFDNVEKAVEDMITAYTDAAERSPVDFVDYKFEKSDDQKDFTKDQEDSNKNYDTVENREIKVREMNSSDLTEIELKEDDNAEAKSDLKRNGSSITLEPGIYSWNDSVEISNSITLSGSSDDVWIFQISENLTVSSDIEITLSGGAVAEHVFWQVAGDVTVGSMSHFEGIILSKSTITMNKGATLNGRMLAQTDVTLDNNTIIEPQFLATVQTTSGIE